MKKTKKIAGIGIFGALAFITMLFEIPFPLAPWLKFDISDVVVLFAGLSGSLGVAIGVAIIKILLHTFFTSTQTAGVGEITNIIATLSYIIPVIMIYKKNKNILIALFSGVLLMSVVMIVGNYYFITPFYAKLFNITYITEMIEKGDNSYLKYILYYYGGFNLFKGVIQSGIYYYVHRKMKNRYTV